MSDGIMDALNAINDGPYLREIARIRKDGEIAALKSAINNLQQSLEREWIGTIESGHCQNLGRAITQVERIVRLALQEGNEHQ